MDILGANAAAKTITEALPQVTAALDRAEASVAYDLTAAEKAFHDTASEFVAGFADAVSQILTEIRRADGAKLSLTIGGVAVAELRLDLGKVTT